MALSQESQYTYQELYKSSNTKDCLSLSQIFNNNNKKYIFFPCFENAETFG